MKRQMLRQSKRLSKNRKDYIDFITGVDEIALTDDVIDHLVKNGIDGVYPTRERLIFLRESGFTHYNTKRKSFVTPSEYID
jgi:hypothetical protein